MSDGRAPVLAYLAVHRVMTLATTGKEGVWAAAVFYVNDGFDLIFLSAGHTRHGRNIAQNPRVAATVQEDYADWADIKGVQCEGRVLLLEGDERDTAVTLYAQKYPFLQRAPAPIRAALHHVNWYRLCPDRLYFVDNSKGFGHRDEVRLTY
ncbi:MAG: pyridoxamine 5'-phosphate oxidase family protein [Ardenticatenaceae bacterium]|nr:pyridoxamine 5'-phosphate oxidase family protein [Anaerolineales bacterium]MCB8921292.1 pyridoxamine 5'-phosphate oxidase family protein [Ardenticatenaceae bacterium]MCB8990658.1 pyridoxamine 5'-phosphate oxidase family protein [Ardenticatenaceae bacterium]